jgi:hypothetical protein
MQGINYDNLAYSVIDIVRREIRSALDEMSNSGELNSYVQNGATVIINNGNNGNNGNGNGNNNGGGEITLPDSDFDLELIREEVAPFRLTGVRTTYLNGMEEIITFIRTNGKLSAVIATIMNNGTFVISVRIELTFDGAKLTAVSSRSST